MDFIFRCKTRRLPGTTHDWMRTEVQLTKDEKKMVSFVVLLVFERGDTYYQIVKHDCAHGKYHIHRYYEGPHSKVRLSEEPISNELYYRAKKEVVENGISYRERFMRRLAQIP